jgi:hypothetical protein
MKTLKIYEPFFEPIGHLYHTADGTVLDSVTTIIKAELGLYQYAGVTDAAGRGTRVHMACQYFDEGDLDENTISDEVRPYLEQYKLALAAHDIQVDWNEKRRYHPVYLYAGSADKGARVAGVPSIIDIKTGKEEAWHFLQLGPYGKLVEAEYPHKKYYDLYLKPDGFKLVEQDGKRGMSYFLALLAAHNLKKNLGYRK